MVHQSLEAEKYVLGGAINQHEIMTLIADRLVNEHFLDPFNLKLFGVMCNLFRENGSISAESVGKALKADKPMIQMMMNYMTEATSTTRFDFYIAELERLRLARSLETVIIRLAAKARAPDLEPDKLLDDAISKLLAIQSSGYSDTTENASEIFDDLFKDGKPVLNQEKVISSGFPALDKLIGGFREGTLIYLGARTSQGKTTMLMNFIVNALRAAHNVAFFSLEMSPQVIVKKLHCTDAGVNYRLWDQDNLSRRDLELLQKTEDSHIFGRLRIGSDSMKISFLKSELRRLIYQYKIEIAFVDYLTLVKPDKTCPTRHHEVDSLSKGLQEISKELKIPIIVAAQFNRRSVTNQDKRPSLADFRESGSIEEDADVCLLLHRPEVYLSTDRPGVTELYVAKNRLYGDLGMIDFEYSNGKLIPYSTGRAIKVSEVYDNKKFNSKSQETEESWH
jgi:replicative DNA helicase